MVIIYLTDKSLDRIYCGIYEGVCVKERERERERERENPNRHLTCRITW